MTLTGNEFAQTIQGNAGHNETLPETHSQAQIFCAFSGVTDMPYWPAANAP